MRQLHFFIHFVAYYFAWLICILLAAHDHAWWAPAVVLSLVFIQLLWQTLVIKDTKNLYFIIILLTTVGSLIDTIYLRTGLIIFKANVFAPYFSPPWMISIWISFAVTFFALLKSLFTRYLLLGILCLLGFSAAYYFGAYMGAAYFPHGNQTSIAFGATWALLLPLCMLFYNYRVRKKCLSHS